MSLEHILAQATPLGLFVMGAFNDDHGSVVLLGAAPAFWPEFKASPEHSDGLPNPIDRWSKRHINAIAVHFDGTAVFPSDGPPYAPFIAWALKTGRFWQSPTGMMVHDTAGLMISIRGAIKLPVLVQSQTSGNPCDSCADQPCATACPVNALSLTAMYDVPTCKAYLDTPAGNRCMSGGCHVRTACPISRSFNRDPAQSAFHMRAFRGH
jgi:hypothetical protein